MLQGTSGNDTISGLGGQDKLYGEAGADTINGGSGGDYLYGGLGADTLTGGDSYDNFVFNTALNGGVDRITDFSHAYDTMRLENAVFTALTSTGYLPSSAFYAGAGGARCNRPDHLQSGDRCCLLSTRMAPVRPHRFNSRR